MKLDNVFTVGVRVGQAWDVLTDLEAIAPCMPGAVLTGVNDGVYTGKVKIKVGPVTAEYSGTAQFTEKDPACYRAVIDARGRDSRGNGNANAVISAQLLADGESTTVTVTTDLTIAGRIAQFGSGMIKEVSAKLLDQFVTCLEAKLGGDPPGEAAAGEPAADAATRVENAAAKDADRGGDVATSAVYVPGTGSGVVAEPAPIDLLNVAGGAISRRLVPALMGLVIVAAVIYVIVRW
jgi:carbon monoxide dehydrogenase subunit G